MDRREFVKKLAIGTGCLVLLPTVTACSGSREATKEEPTPTEPTEPTPLAEPEPPKPEEPEEEIAAVPTVKPDDWDPIAYNKERGLAGAIPETYHDEITGEKGDTDHLGKHLPYIPKDVKAKMVPAGFIALMWGDPEKGYAKHPNAEPNESNNNEGHWYNWIRLRKAVEGEAEELQSAYDGWPKVGDDATGKYAAQGGGDITADGGKNTIYLAALPSNVKPGDTVRIHAHCLTHGEYVDFITV